MTDREEGGGNATNEERRVDWSRVGPFFSPPTTFPTDSLVAAIRETPQLAFRAVEFSSGPLGRQAKLVPSRN